MSKKYVSAGPRINPDNEKTIGGATVLYEAYIKYADANDMSERHFNVSEFGIRRAGWKKLFQFLLVGIKCENLIYFATINHALYLGPILAFVRKMLFGKRTKIRLFGGNHEKTFTRSFVWKLTEWMYKKSEAEIYTELKSCKEFLVKRGLNSEINLNARPVSQYSSSALYEKKFVITGRLCKEKGSLVAIEAFARLTDCSLELWGPIGDEETKKAIYSAKENVKYCGSINYQKVPAVISNNNYMIMLTSHEGEGVPGVIVEAFSVGVPVIANYRLKDMQVTDERDGTTFVECDVDSLVNLIKDINSNEYIKKRKMAKNSFSKYEECVVFGMMLEK